MESEENKTMYSISMKSQLADVDLIRTSMLLCKQSGFQGHMIRFKVTVQ